MKLYDKCSLIPAAARVEGNCGWCGKELPRTKAGKISKSRRWCTRACSRSYSVNHFWNYARKAALARDGYRCQSCGESPTDIDEPDHEQFDSLGDYHEALADYRAAVKKLRLEVHHREPLQGRGYSQTCLHHLDNLLVLCHICHRQSHSVN